MKRFPRNPALLLGIIGIVLLLNFGVRFGAHLLIQRTSAQSDLQTLRLQLEQADILLRNQFTLLGIVDRHWNSVRDIERHESPDDEFLQRYRLDALLLFDPAGRERLHLPGPGRHGRSGTLAGAIAAKLSRVLGEGHERINPRSLLLVDGEAVLVQLKRLPAATGESWYLAVAQRLDTATLRQSFDRNGLSVALRPLDNAAARSGRSLTAAPLAVGRRMVLLQQNQAALKGALVFDNPVARPATLLTLTYPRTDLAENLKVIHRVMVWVAWISALAGLLLFLVASRMLAAHRRLAEQEDRYRTLIDHLDLGIALLDGNNRLLLANDLARRFLAFLTEQPDIGDWFRPGEPPRDAPGQQALARQSSTTRDLEGIDETGLAWSLRLRAIPVPAGDEGESTYLAIFEDTQAQRQMEQKIQDMAFLDSLTDLPNRTQFVQTMQQALAILPTNGNKLALIHLDLDRFQNINDRLGHSNGDRLLQLVGERIRSFCRPGETAARFGGDDFALFVPVAHLDDAAGRTDQLLEVLAQPYQLDGQEILATASAGLVLAPDDGTDPTTLLRRADLAVSAAKEQGGNAFHCYSEQMHRRAQEQHELEGGLRRALPRDELFLVYQPQVEARSGRLIGFEALARWNHPQKGLIPPGRFIPVAESTDLIRAIGTWTLQTACRQNRLWQDAGFPPVRMAVNLSGYQIQQRDVLDVVDRALAESGLPPQWLELELTETALIHHAEAARQILAELKARGLQVAMDDFGTGYSSLSSLQKFAIDRVKIDQSFVRGIGRESSQATLVATIIAMARALGLEVIAEGVETRPQIEFLLSHQCDEMQGFYFGRPMPVEQVDVLFRGGYAREGVCLFGAHGPTRF